MKVSKRIKDLHRYHYPTHEFDFWCVAHYVGDYSPKYLDGVGCHTLETDRFCNENCHQCPVQCPLCPKEWLVEHFENYDETGDWEDYNWRD